MRGGSGRPVLQHIHTTSLLLLFPRNEDTGHRAVPQTVHYASLWQTGCAEHLAPVLSAGIGGYSFPTLHIPM